MRSEFLLVESNKLRILTARSSNSKFVFLRVKSVSTDSGRAQACELCVVSRWWFATTLHYLSVLWSHSLASLSLPSNMGILDRFKKQPAISANQVVINNQGGEQPFVVDEQAHRVIGVLSLEGKCLITLQHVIVSYSLIYINSCIILTPHVSISPRSTLSRHNVLHASCSHNIPRQLASKYAVALHNILLHPRRPIQQPITLTYHLYNLLQIITR